MRRCCDLLPVGTLGYFLFDTLARHHGDIAFADECLAHSEQLRSALDEHGWDGGWYRRAYFDDGTPLGSALSKAGDPARTRIPMDALSGSEPLQRPDLDSRESVPPVSKKK